LHSAWRWESTRLSGFNAEAGAEEEATAEAVEATVVEVAGAAAVIHRRSAILRVVVAVVA
jgi:hypothetical protein